MKNSPSPNESAYQGIDLLSNLFEFLLKIQNDKYLMMSDIKHAFLSIKLRTDEDKNNFSIFWIDPSGNLVAYRYQTIVFGFISSPFILNHLIKFHVSY